MSKASLARHIASERDSVKQAFMAVVVINRIVKHTAVVPKGDRAGLPIEATSELGFDLVGKQKVQQRLTLLFGPAHEVRGVCGIDVERAPSGFGMGANDRMLTH